MSFVFLDDSPIEMKTFENPQNFCIIIIMYISLI